MQGRQRILVKLTGQLLQDRATGALSLHSMHALMPQIKDLMLKHDVALVVGGGNLFRGAAQGKSLGLPSWTGHSVGMLATVMNGLMIADVCREYSIKTTVLSAISCPSLGLEAVTVSAVSRAFDEGSCIIFVAGTGNPYFTTDTAAVLRALQIEADELWKATHVDGVYDCDPRTHAQAVLLPDVTYAYALEKKLAIMDSTALALAAEHALRIRVFDVFAPEALRKATQEVFFGSVIHA